MVSVVSVYCKNFQALPPLGLAVCKYGEEKDWEILSSPGRQRVVTEGKCAMKCLKTYSCNIHPRSGSIHQVASVPLMSEHET